MSPNWSELFSQLETLQREGSSATVLKELGRVRHLPIPDSWRVKFADLCRRAGSPLLSLRVLSRGMDGWGRLKSDQERLFYAAGLFALGNRREAQRWLGQIRAVEVRAEGKFFEGLALMRQWDYVGAQVSFADYETNARPDSYRRLVVSLNIVACLVAVEQIEAALTQINLLRPRLEQANAALLLFNLKEIELQALFLSGRLRSDETPLPNLDSGPEAQRLFVEKWLTLARIRDLPLAEFQMELSRLKDKARQVNHWETLRDLDFYEVQRTRDLRLYSRIFWGTPYPEYRTRLMKLGLNPADEILLGPPGDAPTRMDPWPLLRAHGINARLLRALIRDLYRPMSLGDLFESIHPEETFNPETSPARLRRGLQRLNRWLKQKYFGVVVRIRRGDFRLEFDRAVVLVRPMNVAAVAQIAPHFPGNWFARSQLERALDISGRSARRQLASALERGLVETKGRGPNRVYRLVVSPVLD